MAAHEHSSLAVRRRHSSKADRSTRCTNTADTAAESAYLEEEFGIAIAAEKQAGMLLQWRCFRLLEPEYSSLLHQKKGSKLQLPRTQRNSWTALTDSLDGEEQGLDD